MSGEGLQEKKYIALKNILSYIYHVKEIKLMPYEETITVRVSPETKEMLERKSEQDNRSLSNYVRLILDKAAKK